MQSSRSSYFHSHDYTWKHYVNAFPLFYLYCSSMMMEWITQLYRFPFETLLDDSELLRPYETQCQTPLVLIKDKTSVTTVALHLHSQMMVWKQRKRFHCWWEIWHVKLGEPLEISLWILIFIYFIFFIFVVYATLILTEKLWKYSVPISSHCYCKFLNKAEGF